MVWQHSPKCQAIYFVYSGKNYTDNSKRYRSTCWSVCSNDKSGMVCQTRAITCDTSFHVFFFFYISKCNELRPNDNSCGTIRNDEPGDLPGVISDSVKLCVSFARIPLLVDSGRVSPINCTSPFWNLNYRNILQLSPNLESKIFLKRHFSFFLPEYSLCHGQFFLCVSRRSRPNNKTCLSQKHWLSPKNFCM